MSLGFSIDARISTQSTTATDRTEPLAWNALETRFLGEKVFGLVTFSLYLSLSSFISLSLSPFISLSLPLSLSLSLHPSFNI